MWLAGCCIGQRRSMVFFSLVILSEQVVVLSLFGAWRGECINFFRAAPEAYGGFQARGPIGATAVGPHHSHSNARSKPCL